MYFIIPVESIAKQLGGVILYDPVKHEIVKQYVHNKKWIRNGWRGGTICGDYFLATDWQEIHYFNIKKWKYEFSKSKSTFNDLHYLQIFNDQLYVVNTGLDAIEVFQDPFNLNKSEIIFIFDRIKSYDPKAINLKHDWSKEFKTNPHHCHPNCITVTDKYKFVTCFEDKTRGKSTGNLVELNTQSIVLPNKNCHDGNFYKGDYYLSATRNSQIYILKDLLNRQWPVNTIDKKIKIGKPGWWRGSVIHDDHMFIFTSYVKGKNNSCKIAIIDLNTQQTVEHKSLPKCDGITWNTLYQPNLLE